MKKLLLFATAVCISAGLSAQQRNLNKTVKLEPYKIEVIAETPQQSADNSELITSSVSESGSRDVSRVNISSSSNMFGIFSGDQRVMSAKPSANMITFGNRAGGSFGASGNDLRIAYSLDLGQTFTNFIVSPTAGSGFMFRYPSVTMFNPEGNTEPANMLAVYSGPFTDAAGWKGQYFGSAKLDGTNVNTLFENNESTVYINHKNLGLIATTSGHVHVASNRLDGTSASYTHEGWEVKNGMYNPETNTIDWSESVVKIKPDLLESGRTDADRMVFSPDGSVGYILATAIDADVDYNPYGVEWPVVYKTTDHGETWEKIPPFDFSQLTAFQEYLWPTRADWDVVIPRWYNKWASADNERNNGVTVDKNGNLHIAAFVRSTLSINSDSLNYFYSEEPKLLFDVFMEGDGIWNAIFVDTIHAEEFVLGTIDMDHRIAMSRTEDGSKVFVTWADTDPTFFPVTDNSAPDIFTWGFDIEDRHYTDPKNITALTDVWGENFWLHVSDMVVVENNDTYHIPVSTTTAGATENDPCTHHFVRGVYLTEADFINVGNKKIYPVSNGIATVSVNYPNPFNGVTRVDVSLTKQANVSLEVYNLLGQKVYEIPARNLGEGTHNFQINAAGLNAGIYTYSVIANGERTTRKMVIK